MENSQMPLTEAVKMSFKSIVEDRRALNRDATKEAQKKVMDSHELSKSEMSKARYYIDANCHFYISDKDLELCFFSWQKKRINKKSKIKLEQLKLYA